MAVALRYSHKKFLYLIIDNFRSICEHLHLMEMPEGNLKVFTDNHLTTMENWREIILVVQVRYISAHQCCGGFKLKKKDGMRCRQRVYAIVLL